MIDCDKCGNCCRLVKCTKLKGNLCSIYDKRPFICRTKDMYEEYYSKHMTKDEYKKFAKICCEFLKGRGDLWK